MRRLMWFVIGFVIACVAAAYLLLGKWLLLCAAVSAVLAVGMLLLKGKPARIVAVVLTGCAVGLIWNWGFHSLYLQSAAALDGECRFAEFTATDYSYEMDYYIGVDGTITLDGKSYRTKAYIYDDISLSPGDKISGTFRFRYTSLGTTTDPTYHQGKGIFLLAFAGDDLTVSDCGENSLRDMPARLRHQIIERIDAAFPQDVAAFARALLLGDSSKMTYEMGTAFSVSGISHVIAVSGLHVSILFSVVCALCWNRRTPMAIIGIPVLFLFAAIAGFTPSIIRACLMQALMILSLLLQREYDPPTALAFSVLVILAINPVSITSVGFQLSVACVIGIYAFSGPIHRYLISRPWAVHAKRKGLLPKMLRMAITSVSISFSVWIVTTPLCALHFGMVSTVGILTNLLTVWMVSFIFCGIMLSCAVSLISAPVAVWIAWVVAWPMRLVQWIAKLLSGIPYAAVYTQSEYIVLWLILCYILLALFALLRFKRPGLLLSCMIAGLVMACCAGAVSEYMVRERVTVLDVGQGQCVVLKYNGGYYMVDCGGSSDSVTADIAAEYLLSKGILQLKGLILTHYDEDHAGAVTKLLSRVDVEKLYLPDMQTGHKIRVELEQAYADRIQWISQTQQISDASITLFFGNDGTSDNESGICVLFQPNNCDILILGDRSRSGELALLDQADLPKLEVLIVGHHGSAGATSLELLMETTPSTAVISVGDNSFGHPSEDLLERLETFGCRVYRTDQHGTVEFRR